MRPGQLCSGTWDWCGGLIWLPSGPGQEPFSGVWPILPIEGGETVSLVVGLELWGER